MAQARRRGGVVLRLGVLPSVAPCFAPPAAMRFRAEMPGAMLQVASGPNARLLEQLGRSRDALQESEQRFRSNVAIEGAEAWSEQDWVGHRVRIGALEFEAVRAKTRCLATHANPSTGERDLPVMKMLLEAYAAEKPTFAIALALRGAGGAIRVGDGVSVL